MMNKPLIIPLIIFVFCLIFVIFDPESPGTDPSSSDDKKRIATESAKIYDVTFVFDGDTIEAGDDKVKLRVRLIGIDAPEIAYENKKAECYGPESKQKMKELVFGKHVTLSQDPSQNDRDSYGRSLRYVYLPDGTLVNKLMIDMGYAYEYTYMTPYTFRDKFVAAQDQARKNGLGLWSENTCGPKP